MSPGPVHRDGLEPRAIAARGLRGGHFRRCLDLTRFLVDDKRELNAREGKD